MAKALTASDVTNITGESEHERLVSIEIIFGVYEQIGGLDACANLCSLTMLNCRLQRIGGLDHVASTLTRLCLSDQDLTSIEGLALPHLRQLLLDHNRIKVIENLEGCPKLQKLWLTHNRITAITGLDGCTDLRELWLQHNHIAKIGDGLSRLTNLHSLALARNDIATFEELSRLAHLPHLCSLSLHDEHYGSNPITHESGYKTYVLNQLPQVRVLDGLEVLPQDQHVAEDAYFKRVLAFNDRIDRIQQDHERAMTAIDSRRTRNQSHADLLQSELVTALQALETSIHRGREAVAAEQSRQELLREKHATTLQNTLDALDADFAAHVDTLLQAEMAAADHSDALFEILEARAAAEEEQALVVVHGHVASPSVGMQLVSSASPEFRYLVSLFVPVAQVAPIEGDDVKVLQLYKCHVPSALATDADLYFYVAPPGPPETVFAAPVPLVVCSDPWAALAWCDEQLPPASARHRHVLLARAPIATNVVQWPSMATMADLVAALKAWQMTSAWVQIEYQVGKHSGTVLCCAHPDPPLLALAPEYYCTTFATPASIDEAELTAIAMGSSAAEPSILDSLQSESYDRRLDAALAEYTEALWADIAPAKAMKPEADDRRKVAKLHASVQQEHDAQKSLLRQQLHKASKR
ncbi:hypothetical protein ACHHYP_05985 [Achlya hypogyna]|uniref:Uncharacterized protein n=1 Tax=Achlya hypogyna TaxID=1202772 RepID=A0A1V9YWD5_ACHHY|nr:hypothetical protein ACHHYP_05985 [Achlya hypogyna]